MARETAQRRPAVMPLTEGGSKSSSDVNQPVSDGVSVVVDEEREDRDAVFNGRSECRGIFGSGDAAAAGRAERS